MDIWAQLTSAPYKVPPAHKARKVIQVILAQQALKVLLARKAQQAPQEQQAHKVRLVLSARLVHKARLGSVSSQEVSSKLDKDQLHLPGSIN